MATWKIICDDVIRWAAEYKGPKFHALLADPSYALSKKKKVDPDTPVEVEIKTVDDLVKAYHSFQQWGDTGFMSKSWDTAIGFNPETWRALAEHLLPGGFLFVFASSRGWHRLACALEDANLIIQPSIFNWHTGEVMEVPFCLGWVQGSSFPKATNISRGIDKAAGKLGEREVVGRYIHPGSGKALTPENMKGSTNPNPMDWGKEDGDRYQIERPVTDLARAWEGHRYGGQILKNALEPIIVAQKPWEGKRLDCIVRTGAGALNIDKARIGTRDSLGGGGEKHCAFQGKDGWGRPWMDDPKHQASHAEKIRANVKRAEQLGRWPSNFVLCHKKPEPCPACDGIGFDTWETWYAKAKDYGGDREEWDSFSTKVDGKLECGYCNGKGIVGVKRVKGDGHHTHKREIGGKGIYGGGGNTGEDFGRPHVDPDGYERVDDFRCTLSCPVARLDEQAGERKGFGGFKPGAERQASRGKGGYHGSFPTALTSLGHNDSGGPSRFYYNADWSHEVAERIAGADPVRYCPKAARKERDAGLENLPIIKGHSAYGDFEGTPEHATNKDGKLRNNHPCIKPIALCKWLATLLLPPKEYAPRRILIPFCGTMSEGIGALLAGWDEIVGIDSEQEYCDIGEARMKFWSAKMQETGSLDPKTILKSKASKQMPLELDSV